MKKRSFILFIFVFLISSNLSPVFSYNELEIEVIDRLDGLSNMSVSSIIQDKYGFLWFATQGGLNYYDGKNYKIYDNKPFGENDLVHNLIQTMYYDHKQHIMWIGTYNGVSKFNIAKENFTNYTTENSNLSNNIVIAIEKDDKGNLWFGTMNGLNKLDKKSNKIINYEIAGEVVRDLEFTNNRLWIGTYEGLFFLNNKKIIKENINLLSQFVMSIKEYDKGVLTLGLWNGGVVDYDYMEQKIINKHVFEYNKIYTVLKTNEKLYVGTWGNGLYEKSLKNDDIKSYNTNDFKDIPHDVIYSIYKDKEGIVWIGTNGGGIIKINSKKRNLVKFSSKYHNEHKISSGKINDIYQDKLGNFWFAIYEKGLNKYNNKKNEIYKYNENNLKIPSNSVTKIFETIDKDILLGDAKGISKYDWQKDKFFSLNILPENTRVYALEEDKKYLWIGTYYNGLYRYTKSNEELINFTNKDKLGISDNLIYDLLIDHKNRLWIATNHGLNLLEKDKLKFKKYFSNGEDENSLGSNVIRALFQDSNKNIWIAMTGGGIAKYNEKTDSFKSLTKSDGLASNIVLSINESNNGKIWLTTHNGLSIIDKNLSDIQNLTPTDGIGALEFNVGNLIDNKGNLYFGSVYGITVIPKDYFYETGKKPVVYIKDISVFNKSIKKDKYIIDNQKYNLDYNDRYIKIDLASVYYSAPNLINYYYKLEGFNETWINNKNKSSIEFSDLKPGQYTLNIKAKSIKSDFSDIKKIYLNVEKPWYLKYNAFIIYGIFLLLIIYLSSKIYNWYLFKYKNIKLEKENEELEEISTRDELTGLYNRRYFNALINDLLKVTKRQDSKFSFLLLDLDDFKTINDKYGHLAGDDYLRDFSKLILEKCKRSNDFVIRYAGDEFVIVLLDLNKKETLKIAKDIKSEVIDLKVRKEYSKDDYNISLSIGIVHLDGSTDLEGEEIFDLADKALYKAKQSGKDRIEKNIK
ncbi:MAG: ligand-binding sensor domain-containing protein [Bacillota bacterium]